MYIANAMVVDSCMLIQFSILFLCLVNFGFKQESPFLKTFLALLSSWENVSIMIVHVHVSLDNLL